MAFKPIETQEDLDIIVGERLKREREKYAGFDEAKEKAAKFDELTKRVSGFEEQIQKLNNDLKAEREKHSNTDETIAALTKRATAAEASILKSKIAHEAGLPYELAERLSGDTEDALREDAKTLAGFVKPQTAPPLRSTEPGNGNNNTRSAALAALAASMIEPKT